MMGWGQGTSNSTLLTIWRQEVGRLMLGADEQKQKEGKNRTEGDEFHQTGDGVDMMRLKAKSAAATEKDLKSHVSGCVRSADKHQGVSWMLLIVCRTAQTRHIVPTSPPRLRPPISC